MNRIRWRTVLFVMLILLVLACLTPFVWRQVVESQIASRLHIEPSFESIRKNFLDAIEPGMSREEVHEVLDQYGPRHVTWLDPPGEGVGDPDTKQMLYREMIRYESITRFIMGEWGFFYDKDEILVEYELLDLP